MKKTAPVKSIATPQKTAASKSIKPAVNKTPARGYPDLHEHLAELDRQGLLITIDRPINKDTELHPLVRWQFRGGIAEPDRKAFLFTNVVNGKGKKYDIPVVVGALAATRKIYSVGMGCDIADIGKTWSKAIANPIKPNVVKDAPCQDIVIQGKELLKPGMGVDSLPIPISTLTLGAVAVPARQQSARGLRRLGGCPGSGLLSLLRCAAAAGAAAH
jgi:hypothetical protein